MEMNKTPIIRRPDEIKQWAYDCRSRYDEDNSEHHRGAARHAEQRRSHGCGERPGDQHADDDQPDHHLADVALELPQVEGQAGVIKDDRH